MTRLYENRVPAADRQSGIYYQSHLRDWQAVCGWIDQQLPADVCCLSLVRRQTFKWYAQRSEVVNRKDVPQDAEHLIEWSDRLTEVLAWRASQSLPEAEQRLRRLRERYAFDYIVTRWPTAVPLSGVVPVYRNRRYAVLAFDPAPAAIE